MVAYRPFEINYAMPATLLDLNACEITRARVTGDHQIAIRFRDGLLAELNLADLA